jgi:hypothetical protein
MISYVDLSKEERSPISGDYIGACFLDYQIIFIFYPKYIKVYGTLGQEIARFNLKSNQ